MNSTLILDKMLKSDTVLKSDPVIITVNEFKEDAAKKFSEDFAKAVSLGMPIIPVVIDSFGGYVYSLISMMDTILQSPVPVATIVRGKAMSCGAMLAAMGSDGYRFITENSYLLYHRVSSYAVGTIPQIKIGVAHSEKLDQDIFRLVETRLNKPKGFFHTKLKDLEGGDWYVSALEAKTLGLVDHIALPSLTTKVEVKMELTFSR